MIEELYSVVLLTTLVARSGTVPGPIGYNDTKLKRTMKKFDFFPRAIDCEASLPFD